MTQLEIFKGIRSVIIAIDAAQVRINPSHVALTDVILAHQNAKRPDGAYATLSLQGTKDTGELDCHAFADIAPGTTNGVVQTRYCTIEFFWVVEIFANDAADRAAYLISGLTSSAATVDLKAGAVPLVVRKTTAPKFTAELIQQVWEGQSQFNLTVAGVMSAAAVIDTIEHVPVRLEPDQGSPAAQDFTIPN